jgi:hypothetical protein
MAGHQDDFEELLDRADDLPDGPAKVAVLEEAVRLADQHGGEEDGYRARHALLDAAVSSGRGDLLLTHYAWCLAKFDAAPDRYSEHALLWRYKWVAGNAVSFPEITLAQLHALIDDMDRRFRAYGAGARAVADQRYSLARHVGDKEEVKRLYRAFRQTPRDHLSNCPACEADDAVDYHSFLGQHRKAVEAAAPILAGRLSCTSVPERTYAKLLYPLLRLGEPAEAARVHRLGWRLSLRSGDGVTNFGRHLLFLGMTDNLAAGLRAVARTLPAGFASYEPFSRFQYYWGAGFLLERAVRAGLTNRVRVPAEHPLAGGRGPTVEALQDWVRAEAAALAARFDARNGTDAFARDLADQEKLHRRVVSYPLESA